MKSGEDHEDWGVFPCLAHIVLQRLNTVGRDASDLTNLLLTVSAIEFIYGEARDLLNGHVSVLLEGKARKSW